MKSKQDWYQGYSDGLFALHQMLADKEKLGVENLDIKTAKTMVWDLQGSIRRSASQERIVIEGPVIGHK